MNDCRLLATSRVGALCAVLVAIVALCGATADAAAVTARAGVEANNIFVGEPVRFQVQVSGSETPERPDLAGLDGFKVTYTDGGANSRRSVTIINGRRTENVQLGYLFNYELRATREGRLTIPAIAVKAEGTTVFTQPLVLTAQKPSETENYKLRLSVSKDRAYVGEQVMLEAVFYFRGDVADTQLSIPLLEDGSFEAFDVDGDQTANKLEVLDGKQFRTGRVRKVVVPRRVGSYKVAPATLSFRGQDGFETGRDFFGNAVRRPKFRNFVIPSNELDLTILALPEEGKPANFAGHVGDYALNVQASPTEVNVGDPITLNISVTGPPLLEPVELPPLDKQENLARDFKVPADIADGSRNGNFKVFTQTIRAQRENVKEIPAIELAYFDTASGRYEIARSKAIPITVRPTRIVTAGDAEGLGPVGAAQQEIQSWQQGIAHNYGGVEALAPQLLGFSGLLTPGGVAVLAGPPLLYAILLAVVAGSRRRHANPDVTRARRAQGRFTRDVAQAGGAQEVLAVFRRYLGDKLAMASDALTFRDVEPRLRKRGAGEETLAGVRELFTAGEASRFAGGSGEGGADEVRARAADLVGELEKILR